MNRYISKTIAEIEKLGAANDSFGAAAAKRARNDVDANNSNKNAFVYDTNAKNFVVNHVTQSLIPASRRIDVGKVPYDIRGLRKTLNAGFFKAPHAPSTNLSNAVIAEVNRRTGVNTRSLDVKRARAIKDAIWKILDGSAEEAREYFRTKKRLLDDAYQGIVMAVNMMNKVEINNRPSQNVFRPVHDKDRRFQITGRLSDDVEIVADVHMGVDSMYTPPAIDYEVFWIVRSPSWTITLEDPNDDVETRVRVSSNKARDFFDTIIVPGFGISTEPSFV